MTKGKQEIRFCLHGPPVPWHRPKQSRSNRIDGRGVRRYKDQDDIAYQTGIGLEATSAMMRWAHENGIPWDAEGEWCVDIDAYVPDLRRRDKDNIGKNVLDGLSGICFDDDNQVVDGRVTKRLSRTMPRTIVTVYRVEGYLEE